jgi:hypothetical protein
MDCQSMKITKFDVNLEYLPLKFLGGATFCGLESELCSDLCKADVSLGC